MKKNPMLLMLVLTASLTACAPSPSEGGNKSTHQQSETRNHDGSVEEESKGSEQESEQEQSTDGSQSSDSSDSTEDAVDQGQKQIAIETLNSLVEEGRKGKVYRLTDQFYVGKTTQTDVYNAIGKPERQDTFDRYNGSMGQASYDLRYNEKGVLVEARYLGTNVERQTNLGGITSEDLVKQIGEPDEKHTLKETSQISYIYKIDGYQLQFILNEKDTADHVNLLLDK
ncbi:YjgB family protein [Sporosarcina sp. A2]|uniref:YjgB family protein n=1 Tax=Sporosarcina sp. A2 TaxID=3393449 RepID=UPI003D7A7A13